MDIKRQIQIILNKICPNIYNKLVFLVKNHYICNLKNPVTFNEKIQWRKYFQHDERFPVLVDKYEVRNYIQKICPEILVPNYGVFDTPEEIDFDILPSRFIIKPTHGFGKVIICNDKSELDILKTRETVKSWLKYNQYNITGEWQYKDIKPRIVIEQLLGTNIRDYKFFCFDGEPYAIQIDSDRYISHRRQMRDIHWNRINCEIAYPQDNEEIEPPKQLEKMLEISRLLSKGFDFVRVDLFWVNEKIYFSELTFTPGNGMDCFKPKSMDTCLGEMWKLEKGKCHENSTDRAGC